MIISDDEKAKLTEQLLQWLFQKMKKLSALSLSGYYGEYGIH